MRHIDLFSGIGGFALSASMIWPDHEVVTFCEIEKKVHPILKRHFPGVPIVEDIREMNGNDYADVSLLTGGFPCQPFSHAGKRKGKDDNRFLWPEMLRVIREAKPEWIIGENVSGILSIDGGMVIEQVLLDLEDAGYEVMPPFVIPACAVNAPHRRDRVWIVAHSNVTRERRDKRKSEAGKNVVSHAKHNGQPTSTLGRSIIETGHYRKKRAEEPGQLTGVREPQSKGDLQEQELTANPNSAGLQTAGAEQQTARIEQYGELGNAASEGFPDWSG